MVSVKRASLLVLLLCTFATSTSSAGGGGRVVLSTDQRHYGRGETVRIKLVNRGDEAVRFSDPWKVLDRRGRAVAKLYREDNRLSPDERSVWRWDQFTSICGDDGTCADISREHVPPGKYTAQVKVGDDLLRATFYLGRHFTLGFEGRPQLEFVVLATKPDDVRQMRQAAKDDDEEERLIVSGIVGGERPYNPDWSYSMGPRSIVLGEVFIEKCDASPNHVENNLDDWRGKRWCPWSSYVEKVGRP